ncbi:hypothetical protein VTO42DRAFT_8911 [Malbranchea cinnamomea]
MTPGHTQLLQGQEFAKLASLLCVRLNTREVYNTMTLCVGAIGHGGWYEYSAGNFEEVSYLKLSLSAYITLLSRFVKASFGLAACWLLWSVCVCACVSVDMFDFAKRISNHFLHGEILLLWGILVPASRVASFATQVRRSALKATVQSHVLLPQYGIQ